MKWMDSDDNKEIITHTSSSSNAYTTESRPDRKKGTTNSSRYDDVYKCTPPYKPLLIAFTYLAIRQLRLPILPSDLVRWCVQGQLPYSSLFEKLPADIQASLPSVFRKRLVEHFNPSVSTTSNIMYNTSALASFLGIPMLPLNAPLIVRSMISALGLPLTVWRQYARLGQLRRHDTELQIFDSNNEMYIENLMAQLIICVMLCPDWETWILMRPSTSEVNGSDDDDKDDGNIKVATRNPTIVPSTLPALNMTTRSDLPQLLATIRSTLYSFRRFLPNVSEGILTFNQPVQTVLRDVSPSVLLDLVGGKALALDCSDLKFWSGSSNFDKSVVVPPAVLYPSVSMLSRETIREIKFSSMSSLPCYSNHTNDPGVLLPAYTALLERCAVYIYSTPIILFRLVLSYEIPMAELSQLLTNYAAVMAVKQEKSLAKSIEQDQTVIKEEDDSSL